MGEIGALALSDGVLHAVLNQSIGAAELNFNAADLSFVNGVFIGDVANGLATDGSTFFVSRSTGITAYGADFLPLYSYANLSGEIGALALWGGPASTGASPPASWMTMLTGLVGLGLAVRRRRTSAGIAAA